MRAAPSVILFTSLSGAGFGILAAAGLGLSSEPGAWLAGYALTIAGLIASTFHLAHPLRARFAFRHWRTSWLSREAWGAVAALVALAPPAASAVAGGPPLRALGLLGAVLCLATVFSTAMIYAGLRAVPRWHHWSVPLMFLACAATGGSFLAAPPGITALACLGLGTFMAALFGLGDRKIGALGLTRGYATGLGVGLEVRSFELPRSGPSFVTRELVDRSRAAGSPVWRGLAVLLAGVVPASLLLWGLPPGLALGVHLCGITLSRWLFFIEATHVAALYYRGELVVSRP